MKNFGKNVQSYSFEAVADFYRKRPEMLTSPFFAENGEISDTGKRLFKWLFGKIDPQPVWRILDIGCGNGWMLRFWRQRFGNAKERIVGVDIDVRQVGGVITFSLADAISLPFKTDVFDLVVCTEVIEHLPNIQKAISEIARVSRPNGLVIISHPNYANGAGIFKFFCEKLGFYSRNTWAPFGHWSQQVYEQFVTLGAIQRELKAAGLPSIASTTILLAEGMFPVLEFFPFSIRNTLRTMEPEFGFPFLGLQAVTICRKK